MNLNYLYIGLLRNGELGLVEIPQGNTNYRRVEMGPGDWFFLDKDTKDIVTNAVEVKFPNAIRSWGIITHFGIFDSLQKGALLTTRTLDFNSITHIYRGCNTEFEIGKLQIPLEIFNVLGVSNG